jgi:hypothetical protein
MRDISTRTITALACLVAMGPLASCSAPRDNALGEPSTPSEIPTRANGLVIRELSVRDEPGVIQSVLLRHTTGEAIDAGMQERFRRNGMRMVRVPAASLDRIVDELGGAVRDIDGWHGQAVHWREVAAWDVDPDGNAVAVDGRIRRFVGGRFRLLVRAWTIPMETGPSMQFELLVDHVQSRQRPLERILGGSGQDHAVRFRSMSHEMLLEPGFAYVLTGADPRVNWEREASDAIGLDSPKYGEESSEGDDARLGLDRVSGPFVEAPRTLGESFFCPDMPPPCRGMLVLVPHLPRELFPAEVSATPPVGERDS